MRLSECPVRPAIDVIEGKWKPIVVNALKLGPLRFGQLRRHAPEATRKVLTEQLRELEEDQIICRKAFGQRWERVEYKLTPYGWTLVPALTLLAKWGKKHKKLMEAKNAAKLVTPVHRAIERSAPLLTRANQSVGLPGNIKRTNGAP